MDKISGIRAGVFTIYLCVLIYLLIAGPLLAVPVFVTGYSLGITMGKLE